MRKFRSLLLRNRQITALEYIMIAVASLFPIFLGTHYSANVYLSWEGTYRLYLGQMPYKDFGLTVGFGLWLIPALFFKVFGPSLLTLIKAQAFINILSALAFRSILKQFKVNPGIRLLGILLYIISFSYFNLWPWYNHSVIVFEFIGIAFLLSYIFNKKRKWGLVQLFLSALFLFLSFFTKQDAGAIGFMIALVLIVCHAFYEKRVGPVAWFLGFYLLIGLCVFLPFVPYDIGYWFNYGQPSQNARLSPFDVLDAFFGRSIWIKFYISVIILIWLIKFRNFKQAIKDKKLVLFSLLVAGILFEAVIVQVTSFTIGSNVFYFHSFAIVYILSLSGLPEHLNFKKPALLFGTGLLILLWWSPSIWAHGSGLVRHLFPGTNVIDTNVVGIHTFVRPDPHKTWKTSETPNLAKWEDAPWEAFKGATMPKPTLRGIKRVLEMPVVQKKKKALKVLNMSEITPLAAVIGYTPETGSDIPLWYHKSVGIFEKQIKEYEKKIKNNYYDLILFEYIPLYNNFFPFEVRDALKEYYKQIDAFPAPRSENYRDIEVYIRRP